MWGLRAQIKELEAKVVLLTNTVASAENRFNLMLVEREYFAEQIRDIQAAYRTLNGAHLVRAIEKVLKRHNPLA